MKKLKNIIILTLLTLVSITGTTLHAADNVAEWVIENPVAFVKQEIVVSFLLVGTDVQKEPVFQPISGLKVYFVEMDETLGIDKNSFNRLYSYSVTPLRPGVFTIPGITVKVDGKVLKSAPKTITALELMKTDKIKIENYFSSKKVYVGQPITLKVFVGSEIPFYEVVGLDLKLPLMYNKSFKFTHPRKKLEGTTIGVPVNNTRVICNRWENYELDTKRDFIGFDKIIIPKRAGIFDFSPLEMTCSVKKIDPNAPQKKKRRRSYNQYPSYFNNDFFSQEASADKFNRYKIVGLKDELEVLPLPKEGVPPLFNGIIDKFDLDINVYPKNAKVGTPITLTLTVKNHPYPEIIDLPPLMKQTGLAHNFMIPKFRSPSVYKDGTKVFVQSVRPTSEKVKFIPSIKIPYFDTKTGKYSFVQTEPVPVNIEPNEEFSEYDLDFSDGSTIKNDLEKTETGIMYNYLDVDSRDKKCSVDIYSKKSFAIILFAPLGLLIVLVCMVRINRARKNCTHITRSKRAFKKFKKSGLKNEEQIDNAVKSYFSDKLNINKSSITLTDIENSVSKRSTDEFAVIQEFYAVRNKNVYSADNSSKREIKPLRKKIVAAVRQIEKTAFILLVLFGLTLRSDASESEGSEPFFAQANAHFSEAQKVSEQELTESQRLYSLAAMKFEQAAEKVSSPVAKGKLLYNAGNAYFFADKTGKAILNYLRAKEFLPYDNNLEHNLVYSRTQAIDEIEMPDVHNWLQYAFFWHFKLSESSRLCAFVFFYVLTLIFIFWNVVSKCRIRSGITSSFLIVSILLGCSILIRFYLPSQQVGVITLDEVVAYKGSSYVYQTAFSTPLHSGTEFKCLEKRDGWLLIQLGNNENCWIPTDSAELVLQ